MGWKLIKRFYEDFIGIEKLDGFLHRIEHDDGRITNIAAFDNVAGEWAEVGDGNTDRYWSYDDKEFREWIERSTDIARTMNEADEIASVCEGKPLYPTGLDIYDADPLL